MKTKEVKKQKFFPTLVLVVFFLFILTQLVVNSILTPLGIQLEALNKEKEYLLEENRAISEEIAKNSSLRVIENLSEKKLNLSQQKVQNYIYIEDSRLVANN